MGVFGIGWGVSDGTPEMLSVRVRVPQGPRPAGLIWTDGHCKGMAPLYGAREVSGSGKQVTSFLPLPGGLRRRSQGPRRQQVEVPVQSARRPVLPSFSFCSGLRGIDARPPG